MKDNDAIAEQIRVFIREELNPSVTSEIGNSMNLLDAGILDSTAVVELVLWLEETFQLEIDPEALTPDNFATLDAMVAFIKSQRDAQAA